MADHCNVFITKEAESDLDEIFDYITSKDSFEKAINIYNQIKKRILSLENNPRRGRVIPELKFFEITDYREIILKPYRIIYQAEKKNVYIYGIFDGRRDLQEIIMHRILK